MDGMFAWLRTQPEIQALLLMPQQQEEGGAADPPVTEHQPPTTRQRRRLKFVDLGSGDGRWVLRAARRHSDLFGMSVGYEINPVLHAWASLRRAAVGLVLERPVLASTSLRCQDLWSASLHDADVVAVVRLSYLAMLEITA
jgi:tRNA G46 methylase TrmB